MPSCDGGGGGGGVFDGGGGDGDASDHRGDATAKPGASAPGGVGAALPPAPAPAIVNGPWNSIFRNLLIRHASHNANPMIRSPMMF